MAGTFVRMAVTLVRVAVTLVRMAGISVKGKPPRCLPTPGDLPAEA